MSKLLFCLIIFVLLPLAHATENVLLLVGGYEGTDRNFIFNSTALNIARTMSARGWHSSAIYGEANHAAIHQAEFTSAGAAYVAPYSAEQLRQKLNDLASAHAPAQVMLHLGGHGTIVNGRYRLQTGPDSFLTADELAQMLKPLLAKQVKIALTLDSCSSGQIIADLADVLGDLSHNLCTVTSTNDRAYVSNRGILTPMMSELSQQHIPGATSLEELFLQQRLNLHSVRPRENLFPQISSFAGIHETAPVAPMCESGEGRLEALARLAPLEISRGQLEIYRQNVERTCVQDARAPDGELTYRGQYSDQCRDSLPEESYTNNISISAAEFPQMFEWRQGQLSGARIGSFENNVRFFPEYHSGESTLQISRAGICLTLLDERLELNPGKRQTLEAMIGEKFLQQCRQSLERQCCHYNFQKYVDLERTLYQAQFNAAPRAQDACQNFSL